MSGGTFEVRSSTVVLQAGFLDVVEEELEAPDGDVVTRYTVRHPGAVVVVPVDAHARVVLVRQYRVATRQALLEAPAGKREAGEPPATTAARELVEEVGLTASRLTRLGEFMNSPGFTDEVTQVYLGEGLESAPGPAFEGKAEERHMDVIRIPLAEALERVATGAITDAKTVIGLTWARDHLAQAR